MKPEAVLMPLSNANTGMDESRKMSIAGSHVEQRNRRNHELLDLEARRIVEGLNRFREQKSEARKPVQSAPVIQPIDALCSCWPGTNIGNNLPTRRLRAFSSEERPKNENRRAHGIRIVRPSI
jgi:hypothetical protein